MKGFYCLQHWISASNNTFVRIPERKIKESKSVTRIPFIWDRSDASLNSLRQGLIVVSRLQRVGPFEERAEDGARRLRLLETKESQRSFSLWTEASLWIIVWGKIYAFRHFYIRYTKLIKLREWHKICDRVYVQSVIRACAVNKNS